MSKHINVNNIKRACLAALAESQAPAAEVLALVGAFKPPEFYIDNNALGFCTGVDKRTGTPCFLLELEATQRLLRNLERHLSLDLSGALALLEAGLRHQPRYDAVQRAHLVNEQQYRAAVNSFHKLARQSKGQALFDEVRAQLADASELSTALSDAALAAMGPRNGQPGFRPRVRMCLALDFEWWEKTSETILEVGWSLWDTLSQRHRSRHWIIKENLNKHNGAHISDNRMNFLFGTSERGSLERAFDTLQAELDALGVTHGLTQQQKEQLSACHIDMVLVGHALAHDQEHAELFEIEWPAGMATFDTQKLFIAYQLEQLDAEAASKALHELLLRTGSRGAGPKPATLEQVDRYTDDEGGGSDSDGGAPGDLDSDDSDFGLPGAVSGLALARAGQPKPSSNGGSRIAAVQPPKRKAVQGAVRVRPWPAGPLPSERADTAKPDDGKGAAARDKLQRQVSLLNLLAALKIKAARLHNAGNDARFTMEAFLALTGHPACADPAAAHTNSLAHDPRYKQQLEASMQAAIAQGWGAPTPVAPSRRGRCGPQPGRGGAARARSPVGPAGSWSSAPRAPASTWGASPYLPSNPYAPTEDSF